MDAVWRPFFICVNFNPCYFTTLGGKVQLIITLNAMLVFDVELVSVI